MSTLKDFDFSEFISEEDDKIEVEEQNIENCRISGIQCQFLHFSNCSFKNVVFENSFYNIYADIDSCEFSDCIFHDTFEGDDVELSVGDCEFTNCLFENMKYEAPSVQSCITDCKLADCNITNININGDLSLDGLEMTGGKIEHFHFWGNQIFDNKLSNVEVVDVTIRGALIENEIKDTVFKNVTIEGCKYGYIKNNTFVNCNSEEICKLP